MTTTTGCGSGRGSAATPAGFGLAPATSSTPNQSDANTTVTALPALSQRAMNASAAPSGGMKRVAITTAGTASAGCQRRPGTGEDGPVSEGGYTRLQTEAMKEEQVAGT
ncbi:hypothetical protein [Streptomyces sp. NPDC059389]|uniref:hypothetical protein n=1 Tax=Streptomyces sp. NPDC059389 TaxID=3346818 RepID=UPI0036B7CDA0